MKSKGMNDYAKRSLTDWGLKSDENLIPCTPELDRLRIFLAVNAAGRALSHKARVLMAEYYDGVPPYSEEELRNTPWTGRG